MRRAYINYALVNFGVFIFYIFWYDLSTKIYYFFALNLRFFICIEKLPYRSYPARQSLIFIYVLQINIKQISELVYNVVTVCFDLSSFIDT